MLKIIRFILILTSGFLLFSFSSNVFAQFSNTFDNDFLSGFSEDGRTKVLVLKFAPSGLITETNSEEFVKAIQRNLSNTNHFTVVGPREIIEHLQDPILADCHDIACGIQMGKQFNADKVMVGQISKGTLLDDNSEEVSGFLLSIRVLDVLTNSLDFSDEIQFTDDDMQDQLFELAERISHNTQLRGRLLSAERKNVELDLGRAHGLKVGDRFVIYTQASTTNLEGDTLGFEQRSIAIAEINRINDFSSDAIILYSYATPAPGDLIKTYINRPKQTQLIADTRRELDTRKRLTRPTRPLVLQPEVIDTVTGEPVDDNKLQWERRLANAQTEQRRWMFIGIGVGAGMVLLLTKRFDLGNLHQTAVLGGGAVSGYVAYEYLQLRNQINALQAEGRVKKYISSWQYQLDFKPQGFQVSLNYKF